MIRFHSLGLSLLLLLIACGSGFAEDTRPNILLVMVDDLGPADLGCYGSEVIQTPRLDEFANQGLKLNQAYAGCTVCAPTRSVLMTGVHMGRTSVRLNTGGVPLADSDVTIPEILRQVGYATGGFGKWGIGDIGTSGAAEKQGFDEFFGYYHQIHAHNYWPEYLIHNGQKVANEPRQRGTAVGYSHYQTVQRTKQFISDSVLAGKPFFCYAPWCPPHGDYLLPKEDPACRFYQDKPWSQKVKNLAAMVTMIDREFGELLDLLDELNVADNTVVIFSSDNGGSEMADAIKHLNPGGPHRGHKRSMYEGGIRTPFMVRWPGVTKPGTETDFVVSHQDVLPTLAAIAGADEFVPGEVTGLSFAELLAGNTPDQLHDYHYWEWELWNWGTNQPATNGRMQALRQNEWKIVRHRDNQPWELYRPQEDPGERINLADQYPERVQTMQKLAEQARVPMRPQSEPELPPGKKFR